MLTFEELILLKTTQALKRVPSLNDLKDTWFSNWRSQPKGRSRSSTLPSLKRRTVSFSPDAVEYKYYDSDSGGSKEDLQQSKEDLLASQESLTKLVSDFENQIKINEKLFTFNGKRVLNEQSSKIVKYVKEEKEKQPLLLKNQNQCQSNTFTLPELSTIVTENCDNIIDNENNTDNLEINPIYKLSHSESGTMDSIAEENIETEDIQNSEFQLPVVNSNLQSAVMSSINNESCIVNNNEIKFDDNKPSEEFCSDDSTIEKIIERNDEISVENFEITNNVEQTNLEINHQNTNNHKELTIDDSLENNCGDEIEENFEKSVIPPDTKTSNVINNTQSSSSSSNDENDIFTTPLLSPEENLSHHIVNISLDTEQSSISARNSFYLDTESQQDGDIRATMSPCLSPRLFKKLNGHSHTDKRSENQSCTLCEMCGDSNEDVYSSICSLDLIQIDDDFDEMLEDWMKELPTKLHHVPLCQLIIPGSHISVAIQGDMRTDLDFSQCNKAMLDALGRLPDLGLFNRFRRHLKSIWKAWMPKQRLSITNQLSCGVRYLHLRFAKRQSIIYGAHGLYTKPSISYVQEISAFCSRYPKELVIIHVETLANMDRKAIERWMDETFDELADKLLKRTRKFADLTLHNAWASGRSVLLFIPNSSNVAQALKNHRIKEYVWSDRHLDVYSFKMQSIDSLIDKLNCAYDIIESKKNVEKLRILNAVIAPDLNMVFGESQFKSLQQVNDLTVHDNLIKWMRNKYRLNVICFDFVGSKYLIRNCIKLNDFRKAETTV